MHDPSLVQNRCFLYHRIGNGTGERRVPVGGMGALTAALEKAAAQAGAEVLTGAGVSGIRAGDDGAEVTWHDGTTGHTVAARFVLANVAPVGAPHPDGRAGRRREQARGLPADRSTSCSTGCPG